MQIQSVSFSGKLDPNILYRRKLNRLNLDVRDRIEMIKFYQPFETAERKAEIEAVNMWKEGKKAIIYEQCFNPQVSPFKKFVSKLFSLKK